MINYKITLAKELGRVPDEYEIGQKMREVVSTHPKLKRKEKENKILNSSLAVQRNKDEANKHRLQLSTIQKYILKHRLPRKQVVPIPSKSDRRQI